MQWLIRQRKAMQWLSAHFSRIIIGRTIKEQKNRIARYCCGKQLSVWQFGEFFICFRKVLENSINIIYC